MGSRMWGDKQKHALWQCGMSWCRVSRVLRGPLFMLESGCCLSVLCSSELVEGWPPQRQTAPRESRDRGPSALPHSANIKLGRVN